MWQNRLWPHAKTKKHFKHLASEHVNYKPERGKEKYQDVFKNVVKLSKTIDRKS